MALAVAAAWLYPFVFGPQWKLAGTMASILCLAVYLSYEPTRLDRSSLAAGAWRYLPAWHLGRLITTIMVIAASWQWQWSVIKFIVALTLQMSALFVVDLDAERHFAGLAPATARSWLAKRD